MGGFQPSIPVHMLIPLTGIWLNIQSVYGTCIHSRHVYTKRYTKIMDRRTSSSSFSLSRLALHSPECMCLLQLKVQSHTSFVSNVFFRHFLESLPLIYLCLLNPESRENDPPGLWYGQSSVARVSRTG